MKRKLKILIAVGIVGFLVTGVLVIWAGISAFNYVALKSNEVIHWPTALAQVENLKLDANALPKFQPLRCWGKAQSLMAVEPWIARHALANLQSLKLACVEAVAPVCEGNDCAQNKNQINTAEGGELI